MVYNLLWEEVAAAAVVVRKEGRGQQAHKIELLPFFFLLLFPPFSHPPFLPRMWKGGEKGGGGEEKPGPRKKDPHVHTYIQHGKVPSGYVRKVGSTHLLQARTQPHTHARKVARDGQRCKEGTGRTAG